MSSYSTRVVRLSRIEVIVDQPAVGADVAKALDYAVAEYMRLNRVQTTAEVYDDAIRVRTTDDQLVFWFEITRDSL